MKNISCTLGYYKGKIKQRLTHEKLKFDEIVLQQEF